jgi:hypothetical protein
MLTPPAQPLQKHYRRFVGSTRNDQEQGEAFATALSMVQAVDKIHGSLVSLHGQKKSFTCLSDHTKERAKMRDTKPTFLSSWRSSCRYTDEAKEVYELSAQMVRPWKKSMRRKKCCMQGFVPSVPLGR